MANRNFCLFKLYCELEQWQLAWLITRRCSEKGLRVFDSPTRYKMSKLTPKKVEAYLEWLSWFNAKVRKPKVKKIETEVK